MSRLESSFTIPRHADFRTRQADAPESNIGMGAARDEVPVARSLQSLPNISEAFRSGQVSYSKVSAMTRIANPDNEAELLQMAHHATAAQVRRVAERKRANTLQEERCAEFHHDTDGSRFIKARLPPESGAIVLKALAAAGEAMYERRRDLDAATRAVRNLSR